MKITKRQLKRIIKEEKAKIIKERSSPGDAIAAAERALIAVGLEMIARNDGRMEEEFWMHKDVAGLEDPEIQMALDQLMDRYNTGGR
jgi:hypothetical protein